MSGNYTLDFTAAAFVVGVKHIAVLAVAKSKIYGQADPALTYTNDPLSYSDSFTGALTRTAGEDVGSYAITQGSLALSGNYTLDFTAAAFTIAKANPILGTLADRVDSIDSGSFTISNPSSSTPGTFTYSSSNLAVCSVVGNVVTYVAPGTCVITAAFTPSNSVDYLGGGTVTMNVTVTASTVHTVALSWNCGSNTVLRYSGAEFKLCDPVAVIKGTTTAVLGAWTYTSSNTNVVTLNGIKGDVGHPQSVGTAIVTGSFAPANPKAFNVLGPISMTIVVTRSGPGNGADLWVVTGTAN